MNISLRKANAIQNSILEAIRSLKIVAEIEINEFQDAVETLQKSNDQLFEADSRRQKLLLAYYNIRGLVGAANAQNGIDLNLTKAAFIDKRIQQLEEIANCKPVTSLEIIQGKLEKIRNRKDDASRSIYGREESVITSVVGEEQINQAKDEIKNLKKQKQKLNDDVLELNIKTEIPLSEDVVKTLTEEGII